MENTILNVTYLNGYSSNISTNSDSNTKYRYIDVKDKSVLVNTVLPLVSTTCRFNGEGTSVVYPTGMIICDGEDMLQKVTAVAVDFNAMVYEPSIGETCTIEEFLKGMSFGDNFDDIKYITKDEYFYSPPHINSAGKANGVYAITMKGELIDYNNANESCIGVALITDNQRIMIEKNGENNTISIKEAYDTDGATYDGTKESLKFVWGHEDTVIKGIAAEDSKDDIVKDLRGKENTNILLTTEDNTFENRPKMATYCRVFNNTPEENYGYKDWYIPAIKQLYEIVTPYKSDINKALFNIGGVILEVGKEGLYGWDNMYWSSTQANATYGKVAVLDKEGAARTNKGARIKVRLIRDID